MGSGVNRNEHRARVHWVASPNCSSVLLSQKHSINDITSLKKAGCLLHVQKAAIPKEMHHAVASSFLLLHQQVFQQQGQWPKCPRRMKQRKVKTFRGLHCTMCSIMQNNDLFLMVITCTCERSSEPALLQGITVNPHKSS